MGKSQHFLRRDCHVNKSLKAFLFVTMKATAGIEFLDAADASWMDRNWMWISATLGAVLTLFLFTYNQRSFPNLTKYHWYGLLISAVYSVHQLEEHGCDVFGRYYMFVPIFNKSVASRIGVAVTARGTTYINLINIWFCFPVCTYLSTKENMYMPIVLSWAIAVVNGLTGHVIPLLDEYIPGAFQSIFMVPLGFYVLLVVFEENSWIRGVIIPLIYGAAFHLIALIAPFKFFTDDQRAGSGEFIVPAFQIFGGIIIPYTLTYLMTKTIPNKKQS